jgi:hypothetical protein
MKLSRLLILALTLGQEILAQGQSTFNKRYDPFGGGEGQFGISVEVLSNAEYVVFSSSSWADTALNWSYSSVISALRLDAQGVVLAHDHVNIPYYANYAGWANSSFVCADGSLALGGGTYEEDGTQRPGLFRFDAAGVPMGHWLYGAAGEEWIGRQGKQTPDGGYVICGETSSTPSVDAFVIKTDADGVQEWVQTYGGTGNDYSIAIDRHPVGGWYMGGQYGTAFGNPDMWVQALNDTGEVVWSRVWGSPYRDTNAHLTTASDGHVLVGSGWGMSSSNTQFRLYLAKVSSSDGELIWSSTFGGTMVNTTFLVVQEVEPAGDLVAVGQATPQGATSGVLLRTTSEGDSLWMRYYQYHDALVTNGQGQLRDVQPTPDGGFIAVGMAFPGGPYSQDVWVIKTDSMGCLEPGCHLITGMETQITNLRGALSVAPNPVAAGGAVQVSIALPENFTPQGALKLTLVSSDGRVVHEEVIGGAGHSERSEGVLTALRAPRSAGLYHIHLSDASRWISGAKLVVE